MIQASQYTNIPVVHPALEETKIQDLSVSSMNKLVRFFWTWRYGQHSPTQTHSEKEYPTGRGYVRFGEAVSAHEADRRNLEIMNAW